MQKGFTLVETLVAITILLLVVVGPMTVAQKGIQNAYHASEQATAVFLAQEAIEAVREVRDNDALEVYRSTDLGQSGESSGDWITESDLDSCNGNGCSYSGGIFSQCSGNEANCGELFLDGDGRYVANGVSGTVRAFTRIVTVNALNPAGTAEVSVVVSWDSPVFSSGGQVTLQTWIYDQYQRYE